MHTCSRAVSVLKYFSISHGPSKEGEGMPFPRRGIWTLSWLQRGSYTDLFILCSAELDQWQHPCPVSNRAPGIVGVCLTPVPAQGLTHLAQQPQCSAVLLCLDFAHEPLGKGSLEPWEQCAAPWGWAPGGKRGTGVWMGQGGVGVGVGMRGWGQCRSPLRQ